MSFVRTLMAHAIAPALELTLHGLTPLGIVSALTFGNIAVLFTLGSPILNSQTAREGQAVRGLIALWVMGSISILLWAACVVFLRRSGVL